MESIGKMIFLILLLFIPTCYGKVRTTPYLPAGTKIKQLEVIDHIKIADTIFSTTSSITNQIKVSTAQIDYLLKYKKSKVIIEGDSHIKGNLMVNFNIETDTITAKYIKGKSPIYLSSDLLPNTTNISLGSLDIPFNRIRARKIGGASPITIEDSLLPATTDLSLGSNLAGFQNLFLIDDNNSIWKIKVSTIGELLISK